MNLNSQSAYEPPQPDNPSDEDRYLLSRHALEQKGWPEDFEAIRRQMSPPAAVTDFARAGEFRGLSVGIVGGGLAGLSAAYELRKLGMDVTVYDTLADRVGGRVYTYYFNERRDLYHEFGAMRIPAIHETVWHYLNLFRLPTRPFIQSSPNAFLYLKGTRVRNDPEGLNVARRLYPLYHLSDWERTRSWQELFSLGIDSPLLSATTEGRLEILQVKPEYRALPRLWGDNTSLRMMQAAGLSQEAISLVSNFQPLLAGNLYNSYIDFVQEDYPANLSYLYEIPGGMVRLPMAFYDSLMQPCPYPDIPADRVGRAAYCAGCRVDGIGLDSDGKKVRLKLTELESGRCAEALFDYVVCAIPFSTLRTVELDPLFSNIKMRAIREVNYAPAQKTLLLCRERFWEREGIVGGGSFTDLPIASCWYPSDHAACLRYPGGSPRPPWEEPGVMIAAFNFGLDTTRLTNQPADARREEILRQVAQVHGLSPAYLDHIAEKIKTVNWDEVPSIRGAVSFFSPEQKNLFSAGMAQSEYGGRIFFAGEHISAFHRWMQGALQTGMQAADDLAAACAGNGQSEK